MSEPRTVAHGEPAASHAFAWPPRRGSDNAAAPADRAAAVTRAGTNQTHRDVASRVPSAPQAARSDWMGVYDAEQPTDTPAAPRRGGVSLRVMIAVLAAIVAAQAIALALLIRRPPAMPTPPSVVVASEPSPALAIAPQPDPAAQTPAATTLSVTGATGATVFIDGERRGVSPLTVSGLASGRHQVRIATADGSASQDVTLAAGSSASVLFPTPRSGWIDIRTPFRVTVNEGARQIAVSGDGPVSLSAGAHTLTLRNDDLGYRYDAKVTVTGGDMAVIRPPVPQGVLQVNALPWANVYVDGEPAGDTPIGQLRVPLGSHEVRFVHPQYGERLVRVTVGAQSPARVSVDLR